MTAAASTPGRRAEAAARTRARILAATREILSADAGVAVFSLEAVARAAGVTRVTVYNRFGTKRGLVEALSDDLATRAEIGDRLGAAFRSPTALQALDALVDAFAHFWTVDRVIIRRLHALAALDPEIGRGDEGRNRRRRDALTLLLRRLQSERGAPTGDGLEEVVALLHMLTSFEAMDLLAGADRSPTAVAPLVKRLAREALGLLAEQPTSTRSAAEPSPPVPPSPPVMSSEVRTSPPSGGGDVAPDDGGADGPPRR